MSEQYVLVVMPLMPLEWNTLYEITGILKYISNKNGGGPVTSGTLTDKNLDLHFPEKKPEYENIRNTLSDMMNELPEGDETLKEQHMFFKVESLGTVSQEDLSSMQEIYSNLVYGVCNKT